MWRRHSVTSANIMECAQKGPGESPVVTQGLEGPKRLSSMNGKNVHNHVQWGKSTNVFVQGGREGGEDKGKAVQNRPFVQQLLSGKDERVYNWTLGPLCLCFTFLLMSSC